MQYSSLKSKKSKWYLSLHHQQRCAIVDDMIDIVNVISTKVKWDLLCVLMHERAIASATSL